MSKQTQTHHEWTINLDSRNNSSSVTQPKKGKKETSGALETNLFHSQLSHFNGSGLIKGTKMVEHEDNAKGTGEN